EGVADVDFDRFVFGRVVDAILADELDAALRIGLVDAHGSGRQRHSEAALFVILEAIENFYRLRNWIADSLWITEPVLLAFDEEIFFARHAAAGEQADLL